MILCALLTLGTARLSAQSELRLTTNGRIGHSVLVPTGKYHSLFNSGTSTPHIRLTESGKDYARLKFETDAEPGVFWDIAGLADSVGANSRFNVYYSSPSGGTGDLLTVRGNGNIGIAQPNPEARLDMPGGNWDLAGGSAGDLRIGNAGTNFRIGTSTDGTVRLYSTGGANTMHLGTNNLNRLTVAGSGNVGIGLTDPKTRLDVDNVIRAGGSSWPAAGKGVELAYNAAAHRGYVQVYDRDLAEWGQLYLGNGEVTIGTTTPAAGYKLRVVGGIKADQLGVDGLSGTGDRNVIVDSQGKFKIGTLGQGDTDWSETASYVYNNTHNVGIGSSSPAYKLTVVADNGDGVLVAQPGTVPPLYQDAVSIGIDGDEINVFGSAQYDKLHLQSNGGDVLIGENITSNSKLTVDGPDNNGSIAALELRSGSQKLLLDGNEIENNTGPLHINAINGNPITIGTHQSANGYQLTVKGKVMAEEMRVQLQAEWPDYVFAEDYQLCSIPVLAKRIDELGHLPGMPSAAQIEQNGQHLGEIQIKLVEKIEELTLHIIALNKRIAALEAETN